MTHHEIAERELVESYSQGKLSDADSQAFEEHFFTCDECFAEVQAAGNFIAGVRQAAAAGRLTEAPRSRPAFAFAWAAAAVLTVTTIWAAHRRPEPQQCPPHWSRPESRARKPTRDGTSARG